MRWLAIPLLFVSGSAMAGVAAIPTSTYSGRDSVRLPRSQQPGKTACAGIAIASSEELEQMLSIFTPEQQEAARKQLLRSVPAEVLGESGGRLILAPGRTLCIEAGGNELTLSGAGSS